MAWDSQTGIGWGRTRPSWHRDAQTGGWGGGRGKERGRGKRKEAKGKKTLVFFSAKAVQFAPRRQLRTGFGWVWYRPTSN